MSKEVNDVIARNEENDAAASSAGTMAELTASEVCAKLAEYGIDKETMDKIVCGLGVETMDDLRCLEASDLTGVGVKLAKARRIVNDLQKDVKPDTVSTVTAEETRAIRQNQFESLLPTVPSDESWLEALKTGGVLKVDDSSYIGAIRAALADYAGLYNVPKALAGAMEDYADTAEEQVDPIFYELLKSLTRRNYGDIFAAIPGMDGTFVTEKRRKDFLQRIRDILWPAVVESFRALDSWYQAWRASLADPSMLIATLGGLSSSGGMSMVTPPDTAQLHDAGDTLINTINRVFSGVGVQIAAAMAYDANNIRKILEDSRIPSMVGVNNREMMLKKIGVNVSSNYVRLEQNLIKYVLAFVKYNAQTSDVEVNYFAALWQLGAQINWDELGGATKKNSVTGLTGERIL